MTGTQCYKAALSLMGETPDSATYYEPFALLAINQLLANCQREISALRQNAGEKALPATPHIAELSDEMPADERLARECLPYGLAALLLCDDDKARFNVFAAEFASRLLCYCPVALTEVQEMV